MPSQRSAIGMHKSSPLQKNSGSGPLQARLELLKEGEGDGEGEEEDAEDWLETRPPGATISEGMRALTAVAASESNSSVLIMKMAQPSRNDLACSPSLVALGPHRRKDDVGGRKLGGRETRTP